MANKVRREPRTAEERSAAHRRQVLLQIWLPLVFGLLIVLGLAGLTIFGATVGSPALARWGNLSVVYILIPTLLGSLVSIAVLVLCIRGMSKLAGKMPGWLKAAQDFMTRAAAAIRQMADRLVAPVISMNSTSGGVSNVFRSRFTRKKA